MSGYISLIWMSGIALSLNGQSAISQQLIGQTTSAISQKSRQWEHMLEIAKGIFDSLMKNIRELQNTWTAKTSKNQGN